VIKYIIGPGQTQTVVKPWSRLRSILQPKEYHPHAKQSHLSLYMGFTRAQYKGYTIEFYVDRGGWYEVKFVGKSNPLIRKELRGLAGMKT